MDEYQWKEYATVPPDIGKSVTSCNVFVCFHGICNGCAYHYLKTGPQAGEPRGFHQQPCKSCKIWVPKDWDGKSEPDWYSKPSYYIPERDGKPPIPTALVRSRKAASKPGQQKLVG